MIQQHIDIWTMCCQVVLSFIMFAVFDVYLTACCHVDKLKFLTYIRDGKQRFGTVHKFAKPLLASRRRRQNEAV